MAAGDEPTARKLICKCPPDLILSDIRLPVGDGIRLLQWVVGENFLHIPFVVMTEFASYPDAVRAIKLGAVDYLHKPVHREPLLELLHEILKSPVTSRRNSPRLQRNSRRIRLRVLMRILPDILRRHAVVLFFWMRLVPCPMNCRHRCSVYYKNAYTIRSVAGKCRKRMFVS